MAAYAYEHETPNDKAISSALALFIHGLFLALLIFGVNWKKPEPATMVAELWSNLPSPKSAVPPPPPPPPKVEPEPAPKPEPKVEVKPAPKIEPKVDPKAEIELREKKEKERKAREQELAEKKKRLEQEKAEANKLAKDKEAAEAKRLAQEQADALKKLAAQQAAQAAAQAQAIDKYRRAIADHIRRRIIAPVDLQGNPEVEFEVIQLPGGEILGVKTRRGSGQTAWDNAVERAIIKAQPLPPPPDPTMFKDVRE